jgi:hypothetical protein
MRIDARRKHEMENCKSQEMPEMAGVFTAEITSENLHQASMALRQAGEAGQKAGRLMVLVVASIQQTHRQHGMKLGEAVRRFWPGCQAA